MGVSSSSRSGIWSSVGDGGVGGGGDRQLAQLENRELLAIHKQQLLSDWRFAVVVEWFPLGDASEAQRAIGVAPGEWSDSGDEHLAQFHPAERLGCPHDGWRPEQIAQSLGRQHLNRFDVLEGNPGVLTGGEELESGADAWIGVGERGERRAVQRAGDRLRRRREWEAARLEHLLSHPFGVKGAVVQQRTHLGFLGALADDVEVFLGAIVLASEAEQLEQEGPALLIGGVVAQLGPECLDGLVQLASLQEIARRHRKEGKKVRLRSKHSRPHGGGRTTGAGRASAGAVLRPCDPLRFSGSSSRSIPP